MRALLHYLPKAMISLLKVWIAGVSCMLIGVLVFVHLPIEGLWFFYSCGITFVAVILYAHVVDLVEEWIKEDEF